MRVLRDDKFSRGNGRSERLEVSALHFVLIFLAGGLLVLGRIEYPAVISARAELKHYVMPAVEGLQVAFAPVRRVTQVGRDWFDLAGEIDRLRRELAESGALQHKVRELERKNSELRQQLSAVGGASTPAKTVPVTAGPRGLFGQSITIGAGRRDGLKPGQPVLDQTGLLGRVGIVSEMSARVLMLNDLSSRIAVEVGRARVAALMVGDQSAEPRLVYAKRGHTISDGDEVVTSGASGFFPRGLVVGKAVVKPAAKLRVRPVSSLSPGNYVSVLLYDLKILGVPDAAAQNKQSRLTERER